MIGRLPLMLIYKFTNPVFTPSPLERVGVRKKQKAAFLGQPL
jgi:hypothetical protein